MRILAFAASMRRGSFNRRLLRVAAEHARSLDVEVDEAEFREFDTPSFDADVQAATGFPPGAVEFARRIGQAQGLIIAAPEYNYSLPGNLKNTIDWVSRIRPMPLRGRTALLLSASNGAVGGIRGLWQLRIPLEGLGVWVHPDMFYLPWAEKQLSETGEFAEHDRRDRLHAVVLDYLRVTRRMGGD
jgi:chromate reductase, NAD(P)H dehydrogenase (quinone)